MTEAEFQANVVQLARTLGWMIHHDRGDYRNCIAGDPGFPDLVMAKPGRLIIAELKSEKGKITDDQRSWIDALPDVRVWRPDDIQYVAQVLGP